ncbi:LLM class flavin-dependent oxidoreductase [Prescottella defluvii]|nr:LLM class flavin-dependent oxidoreductase [Prescottella defluvii]
MTLHFHWYLPTSGDGREVIGALEPREASGRASEFRPASLDYLTLVAKTAEQLGFEAVLAPTGTWCPDAWITTAALIRETHTLKFLVAFRPGLITPTLAAQQAAAFQQLSSGRLLLNIVTGGDAEEQRRFGDFSPRSSGTSGPGSSSTSCAARGVRPLRLRREVLHGRRRGGVPHAVPGAGIFFGGASEPALDVAAEHVDTYLTWTEPPAKVGALIDDVRRRAAAHGRTLSFGIRAHVIARDTSEEAWAEADKLVARMSPAQIELARTRLAQSESEGQRRQLGLSADLRNLEVYPGLWAGYGLVRGGAGTALVGSHAEVAALIQEYAAVGVEHFVLSGQPHIEEAYWFGEGVRPILSRQGLLQVA